MTKKHTFSNKILTFTTTSFPKFYRHIHLIIQ